MLSTLFLVSTLLLSHSLGALDGDAAKRVEASVGGAVILPCHISVSDDLPTVEWLKEGLVPNTVFLYRQGCEIHDEKNQAFWYRSSLIMSELKNGNISLRISPVRLSDEGRYKCMTIRKTDPQTSATVDLIVGAASEPKLSVIPAGGDGLTLQCEASCWYPRPVITFLNDQGDDIGGDNPKHEPSEDPQHENCFNTWRRVTVQTPVGRVICRAHEPSMNQTRTTEIYIPVRSKVLDIIITAFVIAFVIGLGLCTFYLCKRVYRNHTAERPKWMIFGQCLGGQSTTIGNTDGLHHRGNLADATGGNSAEHQISIEDLRQTVGAKDIIQKQTPELNELKSKQTPDVSKSCSSESTTSSSTDGSVPGISTQGTQSSSLAHLDKDEIIQKRTPELNELRSKQTPDVSKSCSGGSTTLQSTDGSVPGVSIQGTQSSSLAHLDKGGNGLPSPHPASPTDEKPVGRSMSMSGSYPPPKRVSLQRRYSSATMAKKRFSLSKLSEDEVEELLPEKPDQVN